MTLCEAIRHCEEVAKEQENKFSISGEFLGDNADCQKCAEEHRQLAEWLKELKAYKADEEHLKSCFYCGNRKSCKDYLEGVTSYACDDWKPCEDCISRQAALDAFGLSEKTRKYGGDHSGYDTLMMYEIQDTLEDLPPATPAPKTGRWIAVTNGRGDHECSECGEYAPNFQSGREHLTNYCPNCGAKMVEPEESEEEK